MNAEFLHQRHSLSGCQTSWQLRSSPFTLCMAEEISRSFLLFFSKLHTRSLGDRYLCDWGQTWLRLYKPSQLIGVLPKSTCTCAVSEGAVAVREVLHRLTRGAPADFGGEYGCRVKLGHAQR